jgi:methyl-accepting chemotaxis protein
MPATTRSRSGLSRTFANLGVNTKILSILGIASLVALVVGLVGIVKLGDLAGETEYLESEGVTAIVTLGEVQADFRQLRVLNLNHFLTPVASEKAAEEEKMEAVDAHIAEYLAAYKATDMTGREELVEVVETGVATFQSVRDGELLEASRAGDTDTVRAVRDAKLLPPTQAADAALTELKAIEEKSVAAIAAGARDTYVAARTLIVAVLVVGLGLAVGLGLYVGRLIVRPLRRVNEVLGKVAEGDLTVKAGIDSTDEVGQMAAALDVATGNMRTAIESMAGSATTLSASSEELSAVSGQIAASAEETSVQSDVVSAAAEQVSRNVQTVATGAEEMGASIREIAQNANEAARVAASAMAVAETTNTTVGKLGDSSIEIGNVIKVITSIAEQTNLLALNATIEAARAGEAGKGFAVVANEVKDLARETAKATEDIGRRVEAIQADTREAVDAIGEISSIIARINDYQTTIASAVEEQTATTNEMSRNVAEAAMGSTEIAQNIVGVATAAQTTSAGVTQSQGAAQELAQLSTELQRLVGEFRF